jgi:hypothetical protein
MVAVIGVGTQIEQRADEGERAVIDGVFEDDLAHARRAAAVGKIRRIAEAGFDRRQVAAFVGVVKGYQFGHRNR